jgi:hypothetical protein
VVHVVEVSSSNPIVRAGPDPVDSMLIAIHA